MLTVIIPVLNEAATIGQVVKFCLAEPLVSEIIVVDDQSEDNTVAVAREAGARVLISKLRGKGFSMKEGIEASRNELLVFLDGDIDPYPENTIKKLTAPLLHEEADFVKGLFQETPAG
jgi:glycosyltransferase involved in cell wall biosynthesis